MDKKRKHRLKVICSFILEQKLLGSPAVCVVANCKHKFVHKMIRNDCLHIRECVGGGKTVCKKL